MTLTQTAIAARIGISNSHLSNILKQKRTPAFKTGKRLSQLYGVGVLFFLEPTDAGMNFLEDRMTWLASLAKKAGVPAETFFTALESKAALPTDAAEKITTTLGGTEDIREIWEAPVISAIEAMEELGLENYPV